MQPSANSQYCHCRCACAPSHGAPSSNRTDPATWPKALRFDLLTQLGLIQPSQLAEMVLSTVDEHKAQCLLLGHWPRAAKGRGKASSPSTAWLKHVVQAMQHITEAIAPLEPIYSVMVQQCTNDAPGPAARFAHEVCAIWIQHGGVQLQRRTWENWTTVIKSKCNTGHRNVLVVAGLSTSELLVQSRGKMKALGFPSNTYRKQRLSSNPNRPSRGPAAQLPTWLRTRTFLVLLYATGMESL